MIALKSENPAWPRITLALALFALSVAVSGCADMSENMTTAFADPAKYELYNCKQLEDERKSLGTRAAELQGLISKAETATGGSVVAELAYRNDYIAIRGQSHFAEEAWRKNHCRPSPTPPAAAPGNPSAPAAHAKSSQPSKAGGAVY
jgi:hypothetical protein